MKTIKTTFIFLILLWSQVYTVHAQSPSAPHSGKGAISRIMIASEPDYPPYCIVDKNGKPDGFSIDLFKAVAKAVHIQADIKIGVWNKIKQDLAEGKIDALPLVGKTPERETFFDFTFPYLTLHGAVFVREGTENIHSVNDLRDKEVLVMKGDNAEEYVRRNKISTKIFTTATFAEAFHLLASGEHDAVITQRVLGLNLLKNLEITSVVPLDFRLNGFQQDFCIAVRKGDTALLSRLSEGLSIVIANGTYDDIQLKWFGPVYKERLHFKDILRIVFYTFIPFLIVLSAISIFILRREVKRKTFSLQQEVKGHRQAENDIRILKDELEIMVATRTKELNEKIEKLDNSQQAMLYMVEDLNDMTAQLKQERQKLETANKELEAFSYSVSHDLRAPLRAMDGYARILLDEYNTLFDSEGNRLLNVITENAKKMGQLIDDLLRFSRIGRHELRISIIDMHAMANSVFDEIVSESEKRNIDFDLQIIPTAYGDPSLMRQVWVNLISNAVKFSSKQPNRRIEIGCIMDMPTKLTTLRRFKLTTFRQVA